MKCVCKRCRSETSLFWYPYAYGVPPGNHEVRDSDVFYLCDRCQHEFVYFLDIDLYTLKERERLHFLLSRREENTRILCSQCKHLIYDEEHDANRCDRMVRIELGPRTFSYTRLARLSRSGGECQLFKEKEPRL